MFDLKHFRKINGLTQEEAAVYFGCKQAFISQIERGDRPIPEGFISKIKADPKILKDVKPIIQEEKQNAKTSDNLNFMNVPLVPIRGQAGYLTGYGDMEYIESLPTLPVIVDREYKGKYRCFEVEGDSMDDDTRSAICDRDIVLGREIKRELWKCKLHIRDWSFIIVHKDGISIKSIVEHDVDRGIIRCHSKNNFYEDFYLNLDDVIELYNMIKIVDRNTRN
jgi:transcriptional regulator with XRE-family HTH domain